MIVSMISRLICVGMGHTITWITLVLLVLVRVVDVVGKERHVGVISEERFDFVINQSELVVVLFYEPGEKLI